MRPAVSLVAHACVASCSYYSLSSCVASSRGLFICLRFFTVNSRSYLSFLFCFDRLFVVCDFSSHFVAVFASIWFYSCVVLLATQCLLLVSCYTMVLPRSTNNSLAAGTDYFLDFVVFWVIFHRCVHTRHSGYCTRSFAHRFSQHYR